MTATTRCRPGDLAIILRDDTGYEENIGRIVQVYGPMRRHPHLGAIWLIVPVTSRPYAVMTSSGDKRVYRVSLGNRIEHADAWMMPIRPQGPEVDGQADLAQHLPTGEVTSAGDKLAAIGLVTASAAARNHAASESAAATLS